MRATAPFTPPHIRIPRSLRWAAVRVTLLVASLAAAVAYAAPAQPPPGWPDTLQQLLPADVILLGEQHDAPVHHAMERTAVQWLAARGQLAALVMEMAPAGSSTAGLTASASAAEVRAALQWNDALWPWDDYADAVMAAVQAGVPVWGGNLPRDKMRPAMNQPALDAALAPAAYAAQLAAVREGHCDLLPEAQLPGMVRIQIARDESMARVITTAAAAARAPGTTVLLVAGNGHVLRSRGIPVHLPQNLTSKVVLAQAGQSPLAMDLEANWVQQTPALPERDVCAPLREKKG